jgi:hypothetical protein
MDATLKGMNMKHKIAAVLLVGLITFGVTNTHGSINFQQTKPKQITLFSRIKHQDEFEGYGKAAFSFRHGVRSDVGFEVTNNDYELLYGTYSFNGDTDWFTVTMVTDDCSRIKDLGAMNWSDVSYVPVVLASAEPHQGVQMPAIGQPIEESSDGQVTRAALGHLYVVHTKEGKRDLYAMFRVDELIPSDRCTISWKVVPSPEK